MNFLNSFTNFLPKNLRQNPGVPQLSARPSELSGARRGLPYASPQGSYSGRQPSPKRSQCRRNGTTWLSPTIQTDSETHTACNQYFLLESKNSFGLSAQSLSTEEHRILVDHHDGFKNKILTKLIFFTPCRTRSSYQSCVTCEPVPPPAGNIPPRGPVESLPPPRGGFLKEGLGATQGSPTSGGVVRQGFCHTTSWRPLFPTSRQDPLFSLARSALRGYIFQFCCPARCDSRKAP